MREDRADIVLTQTVKPGAVDLSTALDIELEAGQMSMHDVYLIHGSAANRSPDRRAGVAIRYMPATSHFDRSLIPTTAASGYRIDFARRPIWLLRGVDRSGRNDFKIGHRPEMASA
jgi:ectoine hydroxylase-related dioxygenase (phytanoyl-CoA dioxygenase family)